MDILFTLFPNAARTLFPKQALERDIAERQAFLAAVQKERASVFKSLLLVETQADIAVLNTSKGMNREK